MSKDGYSNNARKNTRNRSRNYSRRDSPGPFVPTVSLERPVIWESKDDKKSYSNSLHRAMGKALTKSQRNRQHPVRPEDMSLVQLKPHALRGAALDLVPRKRDRQEMMERLAYNLQEILHGMLENAPAQLVLPLGELACFTERSSTHPKSPIRQQIIGMQPSGWSGFKAKYPASDETGSFSARRQLALEGRAFSKVVSGINPRLEPREMIADPRIAIIENHKEIEIPDKRLRMFSANLSSDEHFPGAVILGDPVLTLELGPELGDVITLPIRELRDQDILKAA